MARQTLSRQIDVQAACRDRSAQRFSAALCPHSRPYSFLKSSGSACVRRSFPERPYVSWPFTMWICVRPCVRGAFWFRYLFQI